MHLTFVVIDDHMLYTLKCVLGAWCFGQAVLNLYITLLRYSKSELTDGSLWQAVMLAC